MSSPRRFRIVTVALLLAVIAILQSAKAASDAVLWQNYQVAFGPRLNTSFASTSTLDECHTVEQTQPLDFTTSPPQIGCSTYENGDTIGKLAYFQINIKSFQVLSFSYKILYFPFIFNSHHASWAS